MERFTKVAYARMDGNHQYALSRGMVDYRVAVETLALYENTGLTPEQVGAVVKERDELRAKCDEAREVAKAILLIMSSAAHPSEQPGYIRMHCGDKLRRIAEDKEAEHGD